jgi:uncharacterized protein YybS (DUF2232 family)
LQLFFAPILILVGFEQYEWVPFVVGVLTGAHFLPFMWVYDSRAYLFQTVATVIVSSVTGILFMEHALSIVPFALMMVYAMTIVLLRKELKRFLYLKKVSDTTERHLSTNGDRHQKSVPKKR